MNTPTTENTDLHGMRTDLRNSVFSVPSVVDLYSFKNKVSEKILTTEAHGMKSDIRNSVLSVPSVVDCFSNRSAQVRCL